MIFLLSVLNQRKSKNHFHYIFSEVCCREELMQIDSGPVEDVAVVNLEELAFTEGSL